MSHFKGGDFHPVNFESMYVLKKNCSLQTILNYLTYVWSKNKTKGQSVNNIKEERRKCVFKNFPLSEQITADIPVFAQIFGIQLHLQLKVQFLQDLHHPDYSLPGKAIYIRLIDIR